MLCYCLVEDWFLGFFFFFFLKSVRLLRNGGNEKEIEFLILVLKKKINLIFGF